METPQRTNFAGQGDSSFYFDAASLNRALEDQGTTPQQSRPSLDFWTADDEVAQSTSAGLSSAHGTGRHFSKKANPVFEGSFWPKDSHSEYGSPEHQGATSMAGLSTGGTTNSRAMPSMPPSGLSPQMPAAECQLVLDDSSDGSDVECPIDIDALVKVTPSDAKKADPPYYGLAITNNGRLDMNEENDPGYSNGYSTARSVPMSGLACHAATTGDSPAKLTASELRRLARQQGASVPLQCLPTNTAPSTVIVETGTGRRMPVAAGSQVPVISRVAQSARPAPSTSLPGHAVEMMQPTSRRGAPMPAPASAVRPRPPSACSVTTTATATPSPTMSSSHRGAHNDSSDSGGASASATSIQKLNAAGLATAVIEFKAGRRVRCRCSQSIADKCLASLGTIYVIIQSDSGTVDAGVCCKVYSATEKGSIPRTLGSQDQGTVLRIASDEDCDLINNTLPDLEERSMEECHSLINMLHLPLECLDVEATFDQSAVKVFYSVTNGRSVGRDSSTVTRLQRELAVKLRLRVTLEQCGPTHAEEEIASMTMPSPAPVTVTMRANNGIAPSATSMLAPPAVAPTLMTSTRRIPSNYVVTQSAPGASAFSAPAVTPPSLGNSASATRAPSAMSFAVSSLTATPAGLETGSTAAVFGSDTHSVRDVASFVVTSANGSPVTLPAHHSSPAAQYYPYGTNAFAAPWAPLPVPSGCTSPMAEPPMPIASSRRTVPTTFITNVQATTDNITYNGTYAVSSTSGTPIPSGASCHVSTRPSSSTVFMQHTGPVPTVVSANSLRSAALAQLRPRDARTPSAALSRTPSVVSLASPSEASNDDFPVASSRRRVYRSQ